MPGLEPAFERKLRDALFEDIEPWLQARAEQLAELAELYFKEYASRNDYDIDHIWDDTEVGDVTVAGNTAEVRIEWPGLTALFEFGVDEHTITGNPILHFYYERIDQWIRTESVNWGSETGGIPEARAIRTALDDVRFEMRDP